MHPYKKYSFLILILAIILIACNSNYTSKKTGYFNIDLPKKEYQLFDEPNFPYSFEYPT